MYHFFADRERIGRGEVSLVGGDVNHIRNVLRMKPGERVAVSDGTGGEYLCEVRQVGSGEVILDILEERDGGAELPARIYLFQGLAKGDKMEWIIQKAVELGVHQVIPVAAARSVVKLDEKKEQDRVRRWNGIAQSAAKQSGRGIIPQVTGVLSFQEALEHSDGFDVNVIPYERARGMEKTRRQLGRIRPGMDVGIFIGPEGGFEEREIAMAQSRGVEAVSLGRRILRTETAGLMILSVIGYRLEMGGEVDSGSVF